MNASKKTRKRLSATGIFLIFMAISLAVFILDILPNLMRDFHLMSSGIVTRGTVVSIGSCGGGGDSGSTNPTYDVQFVDNKGQTQVENVSGCNNVIGDLSVGDSISILYAPDDPTVIAAQDSFTYEVQLDEVFFAVFAGVIPIGCALAILLIQLRRYLMVHQKLGPTQGNWLISRIKKSKVAVSFSENILCRIGIHQGEWTRTGCLQRRYCIFCGKPQSRERHSWSPYEQGEYVSASSCKWIVRCLDCGKTKLRGKNHAGKEHWWSSNCKRCGEWLYDGD